MRILLYEFVTGGGSFDWGLAPEGALLDEGWAMIEALARDWAALPGVEAHLAWDARLPRARSLDVTFREVGTTAQERALLESAGEFDATILVAPELENALADRVALVERVGARLLCPGSQVVAIGGDKLATERLLRKGERDDDLVKVIPSVPWDRLGGLNGSGKGDWVVKPIDGVGCDRIARIADCADALDIVKPEMRRRYVVQKFVPGRPASVAALGGKFPIVLPPCTQDVAWTDGRPTYLGGEILRDPDDVAAAEAAMRFVLSKLPPFAGYLGVDLILADEGPRIVEVNPRLTTSYVGIRAAIDESPAKLTLRVADGEAVSPPRVRRLVRYDARGAVETFS